MKKSSIQRCNLAILALTAALGLGDNNAGAVGPPAYLTAEHLAEVSLHLPSYLPTTEAFMAFQEKLPTHQQFRVRWDAHPPSTPLLLKEESDKIPLLRNFLIQKRNTGLPGGVGKSQRPVSWGTIIVVAIDSAKQVRGLTLQPESLEEFGEDLRIGQQQSWRYVRPNVLMDIPLPDDPQIQTLLFFIPTQTNPDPDRSWKLKEVGSLTLPPSKDSGGH